MNIPYLNNTGAWKNPASFLCPASFLFSPLPSYAVPVASVPPEFLLARRSVERPRKRAGAGTAHTGMHLGKPDDAACRACSLRR